MEVVLDIAKVIALVAVAALCVYIIILLSRVHQTISTIEGTLKDVATHAIPVLDNVEYLTARANSITESVEEQMGVLKSMTNNIVQFEREIQDRVEGPIRETASVVRAVSKGVKTFIERVRT